MKKFNQMNNRYFLLKDTLSKISLNKKKKNTQLYNFSKGW